MVLGVPGKGLIGSRDRCAANMRGATGALLASHVSQGEKGGADKLLPGYGKRRS